MKFKTCVRREVGRKRKMKSYHSCDEMDISNDDDVDFDQNINEIIHCQQKHDQPQLTTSILFKKFDGTSNQLTIEQMSMLYGDKPKIKQYDVIFNAIQKKVPKYHRLQFNNSMNLIGDTRQIDENSKNQNHIINISKEIKTVNIITSLDVEKNKNLLYEVNIPGPWMIGLITNLGSKYNKNGKLLKKKQKVKCLTILFLTNWSLETTQKYFNTREKVPCSTLKQYCGLLPVLFAIRGFKTFKMAKTAFVCWKEKTRGKFSRFICGGVIMNSFKKKFKNECNTLEYFVTNLTPEENIRKLREYN